MSQNNGCCGSCMKCCFLNLCCFTDAVLNDDEFVDFTTSLLVKNFASKKGWKEMKIPLPTDGKATGEDQYYKNAKVSTAVLGLEASSQLLCHVMEEGGGSSMKAAEAAKLLAITTAHKRWPIKEDYNFKNEAHCDKILFTENIPPPIPLPYKLDTPQGICWLFSTTAAACYLKKDKAAPEWYKDKEAKSEEKASEEPKPAEEGKEEGKEEAKEEKAEVKEEKVLDHQISSAESKFPVYLSADFSIFKGAKFKENCAPLDCKAFFKTDGKSIELLGIEYEGKIHTDAKSDDFKYAARVVGTAYQTINTVREHGLYCHLLTTEGFTFGAMKLPGAHPIRRLTAYCEYGVHDVNEGAVMSLLAHHGTLWKVFNFTQEGLDEFAKKAIADFSPYDLHLPTILKKNGITQDLLPAIPLLEDAYDWYSVMHDYVLKYINVFYPSPEDVTKDEPLCAWYNHLAKYVKNLVSYAELKAVEDPRLEVAKLVSLYMYISSVMHEYSGSRSYDLSASPYRISSQWRKGATLEDKISSIYVAIRARNAGLATTVRSPTLFRDWSYLAPPADKEKKGAGAALMKGYYESMKEIGKRIDGRNKTRVYATEMLKPENLESSVAV